MNNFSSIKLVPLFVLLSIYFSQQIQGLVQPPAGNNAKLPMMMMIKCIAMEREALLSLKQSFVDNDILSSWSNEESHKECCKWDHVHCSNITGHVIKLDLHGTNNESLQLRQDTISPSLSKLTHLQYLDLSFTDFLVNNIPISLSALTNLRYLNLSYCYLGGNIPHEFGNLVHLQYLDLHSNLLYGEIPSQLSNLSNLKYLDLTFNDFSGTIPHQFGNLSSLQNLHIGPFSWDLSSNLEWLSVSNTSSSLRFLTMTEVNLSSASNWPNLIASLPHLQELQLISCTLPNSVPFSVSNMNLSKSLTVIDLSSNSLDSSIYPWLLNFHTSLAVLKLTDNNLQGSFPNSFAKFSSLQELGLGDNHLEGSLVTSIWDLCNLSIVRLNDNEKLTGLVVEFLPTFHHCAKDSLKILDLGWNNITGEFPNISHLSSLQELYLDGNAVNGTLSESVGQLSNLEVLSAYRNSLEGTITEAHFFNLSKLRNMDLTSNNLSFVFSTDWIPPFQIQYLYLEGCKLGPRIPSWLKTQKSIVWLDISNTGIADTVPQWLWEMSLSMQNTNFSHNQLSGVIPNLPLEYKRFAQIDLSSNLFYGRIPSFLSSARSLYLSNNNFTDLTDLLCKTELSYLFLLDLANNQISSYLPDCWQNLTALSFLNLASNKLSGEIPSSMGHLVQIQAIHLRDNRLNGELPIELGNCTELRILDVGYNDLSGPIPKWVGEKLQKLLVLIMQFNHFNDTLPLSMCSLSQIQILDLSLNNITGIIPPCVSNFTALACSAANTEGTRIGYPYSSADGATYVQVDSALVTWKGKESEYKNILRLLKSVDLSSNKFLGEIPEEITKLVGLISLNLSRNMLSGKIPSEIGKLGSLDALDLSRNLLCGEIPQSIAEINRVGVFDLSYNKLSGRIPVGTQIQDFNETSFIGNPELCGLPLPITCPEDQKNPNGGNDDEDTSIWDYGFCISIAVGFGVGFCGVCVTLALNRSWRNSCFMFMIDAYDQLLLVLTTTIVLRKLKEFKCFRKQKSQSGDNNDSYNKGKTSKSDYHSLIGCEYCGDSGHLGKNCHQIRDTSSSSRHATPTGYCLDSDISSNNEIVEHKSGRKHDADGSKAPIIT